MVIACNRRAKVGRGTDANVLRVSNEDKKKYPEVFVSCVVTHAMSKTKEENKGKMPKFPLPLSGLPKSVSHNDLIQEQKRDSSFSSLFENIKPVDELKDSVHGFFVLDGLLMRKWVLHFEILGDPVFQIVVPTKFRNDILKVAHDESGHSGVTKTYDSVATVFLATS